MHRFVMGIAVFLVALGISVTAPSRAFADAGSGEGGGTITVSASSGASSDGSPGGSANSGGTVGASANGDGAPICTYTDLTLDNEGGAAPGGPTPGAWYTITCASGSGATLVNVTNTVWIVSTPAGPVVPSISPAALALQVERSLRLPSPTPFFNPGPSAVVNLATWLWIDSGIWHAYSVTASAGPVSATAIAVPVAVVWTMGDGGSTTCMGPGAPYRTDVPGSGQSTSCSYVYRQTSMGQPAPDGNPNDGSFLATVAVQWQVSWSAEGAPGGGVLPSLTTTSTIDIRVEQIQSVDTLATRTIRRIGTTRGTMS